MVEPVIIIIIIININIIKNIKLYQFKEKSRILKPLLNFLDHPMA
jgi:hypothetical protein